MNYIPETNIEKLEAILYHLRVNHLVKKVYDIDLELEYIATNMGRWSFKGLFKEIKDMQEEICGNGSENAYISGYSPEELETSRQFKIICPDCNPDICDYCKKWTNECGMEDPKRGCEFFREYIDYIAQSRDEVESLFEYDRPRTLFIKE